MKFLMTSLALTTLLAAPQAMACSCGSWLSFYQSTAQAEAQVVELTTTAVDGRGEVTVTVDEVLKGDLTAGDQLDVLGQDGLNCNGDVGSTVGASWIGVITKSEEGDYATLSCASTFMAVDGDAVTGRLFGWDAVELSRADFVDLVAGVAKPQETLSCTHNVSLSDANIRFSQQIVAGEDGDLSFEGELNDGNGQMLKLWVNGYRWRNTLRVSYLNPFTGFTVDAGRQEINPMAPAPHFSSSVRSADYKKSASLSCEVQHSLPLSRD